MFVVVVVAITPVLDRRNDRAFVGIDPDVKHLDPADHFDVVHPSCFGQFVLRARGLAAACCSAAVTAWISVIFAWLMAVAALQLLTVTTHVATMIDSRIWPLAYQTAYLFWSYALLASVTWGGVEGWLDRRRATTGP